MGVFLKHVLQPWILDNDFPLILGHADLQRISEYLASLEQTISAILSYHIQISIFHKICIQNLYAHNR